MLQKESKILTADNAGARLVKCIHVANNKKYGIIGDLLNVVIKRFKVQKKLVKKKIYYGLIILLKTTTYRKSGMFIKSDFNRLVLLNKDNLKFLGTRLYTPAYKELRFFTVGKKKLLRFEKVVSICKKLI